MIITITIPQEIADLVVPYGPNQTSIIEKSVLTMVKQRLRNEIATKAMSDNESAINTITVTGT